MGLLLRAEWFRGGLKVVFSDAQTGLDIPVGEDIDLALKAAEERARAAEERLARAEEAHRRALQHVEELKRG